MLKSISLKFIEVMTKKIDLAVQSREVEMYDKEKRDLEMRFKGKFQDKREDLDIVLPV